MSQGFPQQNANVGMSDPFDLQRFVLAQHPVFDQVCEELREGRKRGHWMWFIFPQLSGLGYSDMSKKYAIRSRLEADGYLKHPILGPRLIECSCLVTRVQGVSIRQILGYPDHLKFRSSMTLFATVAPEETIFRDALRIFFAGEPDSLTLERLRSI